MKWVVTSTYGNHHIIADSEEEAEEIATDQLREMGYLDPGSMILDGLNAKYDANYHGDWEGEDD